MFCEQRQQKILEILQAKQAVSSAELQALLGVSLASVRRDLQTLEEAGLLQRTHGGAVLKTALAWEAPLAEKECQFAAEKAAIAATAADLVQEGETVLLDAGTTTLHIARRLRQRRGCRVKVVTNSLSAAWELASSELDLTVLGGTLRRQTLALVGPIGGVAVRAINVDKLFLGASALDLKKGVTCANLMEAQGKRAMIESASEVILVADHSKFGRAAFAQVCGWPEIGCLVTDRGLSPKLEAELKTLGVTVLVACPQPSGSPRKGRLDVVPPPESPGRPPALRG